MDKITIIISIIMFCLAIFLISFDHGYKHGQIDAINGKIKYKLVKQNNGSIKWEEIYILK